MKTHVIATSASLSKAAYFARHFYFYYKPIFLHIYFADSVFFSSFLLSFLTQQNNLMLSEHLPGEPTSFYVIPYHEPRNQIKLTAKNRDQKRLWAQHIKGVILEKFDNIPNRAKELVYKLGDEEGMETHTHTNTHAHTYTHICTYIPYELSPVGRQHYIYAHTDVPQLPPLALKTA